MYPQLFEYADIILSCNLSSQVINIGLVHTIPDKFENATLRAKTEQKCSASTLERFRWLFTLKISKYHILRHVDYLREDKLHDKMMSAYSKSCGYKKFSVHTNTKKYRFQIVPLWRAFSKSSVFVDLFMRY